MSSPQNDESSPPDEAEEDGVTSPNVPLDQAVPPEPLSLDENSFPTLEPLTTALPILDQPTQASQATKTAPFSNPGPIKPTGGGKRGDRGRRRKRFKRGNGTPPHYLTRQTKKRVTRWQSDQTTRPPPEDVPQDFFLNAEAEPFIPQTIHENEELFPQSILLDEERLNMDSSSTYIKYPLKSLVKFHLLPFDPAISPYQSKGDAMNALVPWFHPYFIPLSVAIPICNYDEAPTYATLCAQRRMTMVTRNSVSCIDFRQRTPMALGTTINDRPAAIVIIVSERGALFFYTDLTIDDEGVYAANFRHQIMQLMLLHDQHQSIFTPASETRTICGLWLTPNVSAADLGILDGLLREIPYSPKVCIYGHIKDSCP